jgi:tetrahydromethanopterin S-methyltransferase subunit G
VDEKFDEVNKKFDEINNKIDLTNKKIDSVEADFKLLMGVFVALGSLVTIFIVSNFPTFFYGMFSLVGNRNCSKNK